MYISRDDLMTLFGESEIIKLERNISFDNGIESTEQVIKNATEEVNGYLAVRYNLPLNSVPERLKQCVAVIVRYRLYKNKAPEQVQWDYEQEIKWLNQVASGKIMLMLSESKPHVFSLSVERY